MSIAYMSSHITNKKLCYLDKTRVLKLRSYSEMSILAGELKFTRWEANFDQAAWEIQNKVTKLIFKSFKF